MKQRGFLDLCDEQRVPETEDNVPDEGDDGMVSKERDEETVQDQNQEDE